MYQIMGFFLQSMNSPKIGKIGNSSFWVKSAQKQETPPPTHPKKVLLITQSHSLNSPTLTVI